jgi:hypothetical protein
MRQISVIRQNCSTDQGSPPLDTRIGRVPHTFVFFANVWVLPAPLHSRIGQYLSVEWSEYRAARRECDLDLDVKTFRRGFTRINADLKAFTTESTERAKSDGQECPSHMG